MFKKKLLVTLVFSAIVANSTMVAFAASGEGFTPAVCSLSSTGALVGSYRILKQTPENGTIVSSTRQARRGSIVTLTVKPDDGFAVKEITVVNENEKSIKLTTKGENKYTFTMPGSDVTVDAVFVELGTQETSEETAGETSKEEQGANREEQKEQEGSEGSESPEEPKQPRAAEEEMLTVFAAQHVNGTLTVSPQSAQAGETITVKVTPSEGFEDAGIVIINEENQPIPIVKEESGSYSFLLPHTNVIVVPTFVKTAQGKSCDCAEKDETSTPQNPSGCLCDAGRSCCSCSSDAESSPSVEPETINENDKNNTEDIKSNSEADGKSDNKPPVTESNSASQSEKKDPPASESTHSTNSSPSTESAKENPSASPSAAHSAPKTPASPSSTSNSSTSSTLPKKKTIVINGRSNFGSTSSTTSTTSSSNQSTQSTPAAVYSATKPTETTATNKKDIPKVEIPNVRMLSVSVPLSLPIQTSNNGSVIVPNQAAILNHSREDNVIIANVQVKLKSGWKPVEQLDLSLRENSLDQSGKIKLTKGDWTVKAKDSLPLQMKVELPTGVSVKEDDIASIEFVFDWEQ